jgi:hypothetical protein
MVYRADISRPQWQRNLLDGVTSVEVISGALRTYRQRVMERAERDHKMVYMYGSANKLSSPRVANAAWCVETWAMGGDGVVPWQTIGKADAWKEPDDLALLYPGPDGPKPSLRLKTFRSGQQLVEYLTQYSALSGQGRKAVAKKVLELPGIQARTLKNSEDDAGNSAFGPEVHHTLSELRVALGQWLDSAPGTARERWHDPRPPRFDAESIPSIRALAPPAGEH